MGYPGRGGCKVDWPRRASESFEQGRYSLYCSIFFIHNIVSIRLKLHFSTHRQLSVYSKVNKPKVSTNQPIVKHHWAIIINNQKPSENKGARSTHSARELTSIPDTYLEPYLNTWYIPQNKTRHKKEKSVRIKKRIRFNWKVDVMDHRQSHAGYTPPAKIHKSTQQSRERKRKRRIKR